MKKGPAGPRHDAVVDVGRCYEVGVSIDWILRARWRAQMNDTPPGTNTEYSSPRQADQASATGMQHVRSRRRAPSELPGAARFWILSGSLVGSALLIAAEFTTLFQVHIAASPNPIKTVTTGSHHSFALIPIALLGMAFAAGVLRDGSRSALLSLGLLGIVTLLIALLIDLPDADATGLAGSGANHFVSASSTPSAGLYLETLGGAVLVITCGVSLMAIGAPTLRPVRPDV
jgi:hypothetical protein